MFPCFPLNYGPDWCLGDSVLFGKQSDCFTGHFHASNTENVFFRKLCSSVLLATRPLVDMFSGAVRISSSNSFSALIFHISDVISLGAYKKVFGINTARVVATMERTHVLGNMVPIVKKVRESMRPIICSGNTELAIPINPPTSKPYPARTIHPFKPWAVFVYFLKELFYCFFGAVTMWHKQENRRQAKVLSACSWPRLLDDGKMFLVRNTFIGHNIAT